MGIPMSLVWLAGMLVLAIIEAATLGLTAIWFAFGCLIAMLVALIGWNIWIQADHFCSGVWGAAGIHQTYRTKISEARP